METFYSILGMERDAGRKDIKKAFHSMALKYHPDRVADLGDKIKMIAENEFKRINEAREVLLDDEKREEYDRLLDNRGTGGFGNDISFGAHPADEFMDEKARVKRENVYLQTMVVDLRYQLSLLEQELEEERRYSAHIARSLDGASGDTGSDGTEVDIQFFDGTHDDGRDKANAYSPDPVSEDAQVHNDDAVSAAGYSDDEREAGRREFHSRKAQHEGGPEQGGWELEYEDGYRTGSPGSQWPAGDGNDTGKDEGTERNGPYRHTEGNGSDGTGEPNFDAVDHEMRNLEEAGQSTYGQRYSERAGSPDNRKIGRRNAAPPDGAGLEECPFCGREAGLEQTYCYYCGTVF